MKSSWNPSQTTSSTYVMTDLCRVLCTKTSGLTAFIADPQLSGLLQLPLQTDPRLVRFLHLLLAFSSQTLNFLPQVSLRLSRLPQLLLLGHSQELQLLGRRDRRSLYRREILSIRDLYLEKRHFTSFKSASVSPGAYATAVNASGYIRHMLVLLCFWAVDTWDQWLRTAGCSIHVSVYTAPSQGLGQCVGWQKLGFLPLKACECVLW